MRTEDTAVPCPYRDDMLIDFRRTPRRAVSCAAIMCRDFRRTPRRAVSLLARAEGGHGSAVSLLRLCAATFRGHRECRFLRCDYVSRLSEDTAVPCPYLLEFVATA